VARNTKEIGERYRWFSYIYEYYKKLMRPDIDERDLEKYFSKTISLIHDLIEPSGLRREKPAVIDFETIKALKSSNLTETQKYFGILNNLKYMVVIKSRNPIYKSIAERVKELVVRWQEGVDISQLRKDIDGVLKFIEDKERERAESKLSDVEFGMKLVLENEGVVESNEAEELARQIYARVRGRLYPGWDQNPAVSKNVERELRMYLAELRPKYKIPYEGFEKLYNRIFEVLTYYGRGN
jgi:type I site-specific restriction-modification system R (restriction) subunit